MILIVKIDFLIESTQLGQMLNWKSKMIFPENPQWSFDLMSNWWNQVTFTHDPPFSSFLTVQFKPSERPLWPKNVHIRAKPYFWIKMTIFSENADVLNPKIWVDNWIKSF